MYKITWSSSKAIYAVWGAIFSFTQNIHTAMIGLLLCIVIDTLTGFIAAPYRGQLRESAKLSRVVLKIITYFVAAITLHVAEMMVLPTYVAGTLELSRMAFTVFCALEIYSILENLRDITKLRAFDILTMNFKKKVEESVGVNIPKPREKGKNGEKRV
ncbi:MAG: phage holin family protein [Clostridia bacterium]|nr:phage holin family protein [Clostridia bacterium]MBO7714500.1 phage holin family protein [Methanobrevibacter sp.]